MIQYISDVGKHHTFSTGAKISTKNLLVRQFSAAAEQDRFWKFWKVKLQMLNYTIFVI